MLRSSSDVVYAPYPTGSGTGVQMAIATGWVGGPCMYFLARMDPSPGQTRVRVLTFAGTYGLAFLAALLATTPVVRRIRRLSRDAHEAVDAGYTAIAPDRLKDELSSLTFVYNDVATELAQRRTRIDDQEAALRRFVQSTEEEVAAPLADLESGLAALVTGKKSLTSDEVRVLLQQAHDLAAEVENLAAAARLRLIGQTPAVTPVDLNALVTRVVARHLPVAESHGVAVHLSLPARELMASADPTLLERAIANVVDNAIRYNRPGGEVRVGLASTDAGRFELWIRDTGRGVTEEDFRGLTAVRRFRGDEGRNRRPGAPGLGLAVAREVADRFNLQLEFRQPDSGGFEAAFSGAA